MVSYLRLLEKRLLANLISIGFVCFRKKLPDALIAMSDLLWRYFLDFIIHHLWVFYEGIFSLWCYWLDLRSGYFDVNFTSQFAKSQIFSIKSFFTKGEFFITYFLVLKQRVDTSCSILFPVDCIAGHIPVQAVNFACNCKRVKYSTWMLTLYRCFRLKIKHLNFLLGIWEFKKLFV